MARFPWQRSEEPEKKDEFTLPDELVNQIKAGSEAASKVSKIEEMLTGLTSIVQADKADREKAKTEAAAERARTAGTARDEQTDAEIEELILTNPREAIRRATEGQTLAIKAVHADNVRREVFEDQDKFKYYSGDIKREVDALLASQAVDFRLSPQNIENCYHTVLGKHTDEIAEGKLKSRFAGGENGGRGTSTGSAGDSGSGGREKTALDADTSADIRKAAKQCGLKYDDYVELLEKEGVI
jgi:hypothetical protein